MPLHQYISEDQSDANPYLTMTQSIKHWKEVSW